MSLLPKDNRPPAPISTTVYNALPSLAVMHSQGRVNYPDIVEDYFWEIFEKYKEFTCLGVERFYNIFKAIEYIAKSDLTGDIAECGVFLGGSIIGAAHFAQYFGLKKRKFYAFDTFQGFPSETMENDINGELCDLSKLKVFNSNFRPVIEKNIRDSGLDPENFVLVEGPVEQTLASHSCTNLAYLRLDTDYYQSTFVELSYLYPALQTGGIIIIDDYGHFEGARRAVDDYFAQHPRSPLLQRVDYSGRCGIKI
jgi:O-methyltransferase